MAQRIGQFTESDARRIAEATRRVLKGHNSRNYRRRNRVAIAPQSSDQGQGLPPGSGNCDCSNRLPIDITRSVTIGEAVHRVPSEFTVTLPTAEEADEFGGTHTLTYVGTESQPLLWRTQTAFDVACDSQGYGYGEDVTDTKHIYLVGEAVSETTGGIAWTRYKGLLYLGDADGTTNCDLSFLAVNELWDVLTSQRFQILHHHVRCLEFSDCEVCVRPRSKSTCPVQVSDKDVWTVKVAEAVDTANATHGFNHPLSLLNGTWPIQSDALSGTTSCSHGKLHSRLPGGPIASTVSSEWQSKGVMPWTNVLVSANVTGPVSGTYTARASFNVFANDGITVLRVDYSNTFSQANVPSVITLNYANAFVTVSAPNEAGLPNTAEELAIVDAMPDTIDLDMHPDDLPKHLCDGSTGADVPAMECGTGYEVWVVTTSDGETFTPQCVWGNCHLSDSCGVNPCGAQDGAEWLEGEPVGTIRIEPCGCGYSTTHSSNTTPIALWLFDPGDDSLTLLFHNCEGEPTPPDTSGVLNPWPTVLVETC